MIRICAHDFRLLRLLPGLAGSILLLTGCASVSPSSPRGSTSSTLPPPRTELVLLNVPEGSGWVAYRKDEQDSDVEDYRVVVIRQATNELIYDSVIPLAASMATHGFELAKDDPRLQTLARNVDQNIIQPLESVVPDIPAAPEEAEPEAEIEIEEPAEDPAEEPTETATVEPTPQPEPAPVMEVQTLFPFLEEVEGSIRIGMPHDAPLSPGDRLFVREPDRMIALPGTEEQILVSKGTVTGLVKVETVKDHVAHTVLLSGYLPEDPLFEVSEDE